MEEVLPESVEMHCPVCGRAVTKVSETNIEYNETGIDALCAGNEAYIHRGNKLVKIKNPHFAYETSDEFKASLQTLQNGGN